MCARVCVFVCVWQEVCACKDVLHPFFVFLGGFFWCDRFQSKISYGENKTLSCIRIKI